MLEKKGSRNICFPSAQARQRQVPCRGTPGCSSCLREHPRELFNPTKGMSPIVSCRRDEGGGVRKGLFIEGRSAGSAAR